MTFEKDKCGHTQMFIMIVRGWWNKHIDRNNLPTIRTITHCPYEITVQKICHLKEKIMLRINFDLFFFSDIVFCQIMI
jgi:hypothetical protein